MQRIADSLGGWLLLGFLLDFLDLGALVLEPDLDKGGGVECLVKHARVSCCSSYLHYAQTQSRILGQILAHLAARLGRHLEGCLEGASLLCVEYGAWSLGSASAIQLGREQLVAIEVCK